MSNMPIFSVLLLITTPHDPGHASILYDADKYFEVALRLAVILGENHTCCLHLSPGYKACSYLESV